MITEFIREFDTDKYLNQYIQATTTKNFKGTITTLQMVCVEAAKNVLDDKALSEDDKTGIIDCIRNTAQDITHDINTNKQPFTLSSEEHAQMRDLVNIEFLQRKLLLNADARIGAIPKPRILQDHFNSTLDNDLPLYQPIESMILDGQLPDYWRSVARFIGIMKFMQYIDCELIASQNRVNQPSENTATPIAQTELGKTQFVELAKALILGKHLKYKTEKEAISKLSKALGVDIEKDEFDRICQKIKGRNIGSESLFLDKLKTDLVGWVEKN